MVIDEVLKLQGFLTIESYMVEKKEYKLESITYSRSLSTYQPMRVIV